MTRHRRTYGLFFPAWLVWACFRSLYELFAWAARASVGKARLQSIRSATGEPRYPWRFRILRAVARAFRWPSRLVAQLLDCCPFCFHEGQCPYHWHAYAGKDYARVFPTRRQRQANRRELEVIRGRNQLKLSAQGADTQNRRSKS